MKAMPCFQGFYQSLDDISLAVSDVDDKRNQLQTMIEGFNHNIQAKQVDAALLKKNKEQAQLLQQTIQHIQKTSEQWLVRFKDVLAREKFRSDLENYFIVIIFGKVKAGKSSLGNFIAQHSQEPVTFFHYDQAGNEQTIQQLQEIQEADGFATNNLECTTEIQGFRLKGLAWIDTPGLGSMVEENGELAQKYIQSADYIIYPTSSAAPMQRDEIDQLAELFAQNKSVTICITKSDSNERKKGEDGKIIRDDSGRIASFTVNKSQAQRQEQKDYVKTEIHKVLRDKDALIGDIIALSAHTAQQAIAANDEQALQASNMPQLYALMQDVIEKKAHKLKSSTPYGSLIAFIEHEVLTAKHEQTSIQTIETILQAFEENIQQALVTMASLKSNTQSDVLAEVNLLVGKQQADINNSNVQSVFQAIDAQLSQSIQAIINQNINQLLSDFSSSMDDLQTQLPDASQFSIQNEYRTISVRYEDRSFVNYITLGTVGRSHSYVDEEVCIGDNREEMILNFKNSRVEAYTQLVLNNYQDIKSNFFNPLIALHLDLIKDVEALKIEVNQLKASLMEAQ
ncbi:MAG: dynamin family protein [Ghiorsea sp.]|nr:dynamin family protein [Ghiorsea sp.]